MAHFRVIYIKILGYDYYSCVHSWSRCDTYELPVTYLSISNLFSHLEEHIEVFAPLHVFNTFSFYFTDSDYCYKVYVLNQISIFFLD